MKKGLYIVSLYPYNDVYQVCDKIDDSVVFQGSHRDCMKHISRYLQDLQDSFYD